jgi:hypothetical protein
VRRTVTPSGTMARMGRSGVAVTAALVLALGAGAGYAAGSGDEPRTGTPPDAEATAYPVPADPSLPVPVVRPDPDAPALRTGLTLTSETLARPGDLEGAAAVTLPVPEDWIREVDTRRDTYTFDPDVDEDYTSVLYVEFVDAPTPERARSRRNAELVSESAQGVIGALQVVKTRVEIGFDATYVGPAGYRRLDLERWFASDDGSVVVKVRAVGRERDRQGLSDLVSRITGEIEVAPAQSP